MSNPEPTQPFGVFHDVETDEIIVRDLTAEEIALLADEPQVTFREI